MKHHTEVQLALIAQLEASLLKVWPSVHMELHGRWVIRAANGYSGRANSASALCPIARLDDQVFDNIQSFFRARAITPTFRVSPLCAPDVAAHLGDRNYRSIGLAHTMTATLKDVSHAADPLVLQESHPTSSWLNGTASLQTERTKQNPIALHAIVSRIAVPVCFASVMQDGEAVGFGIAAIDKGWAEIGSVVIDNDKRGKGLGRKLVTTLLAWANNNGAANAYLQVDVTNSKALRLYRSLGFEVLYMITTHFVWTLHDLPRSSGHPRPRRPHSRPAIHDQLDHEQARQAA